MDNINKINYKLLKKNTKMFDSFIHFNLSGKNINYVILNTLRRIILSDIPIYAFTNFNIIENTSVYNNNKIKLKLKNLPVIGIENNNEIYSNQEIINVEKSNEEFMDNIDFNVDDSEIDSSSLSLLSMYIDITNNTDSMLTVTTNDIIFYKKGKKVDKIYDPPVPILKLHKDKKLKLSSITSLSTEEISEDSAIFSAVCVCVFNEISENDFNFKIESRGQISEKRIIEVAIINIKDQLNKFLQIAKPIDDTEGELLFENFDHTIGNLVTRGLQDHKSVEFAGYNMPHLLDKKIKITYKIKESKINKIIEDVITYYNKLFDEINKVIKV